MDGNSIRLAEDTFLRFPVDARVRKQKNESKVKETIHLDQRHTRKVELQTIRLHPDSQKLILDTLRYIHGPDFQLQNASSYKDKGSNLGNRFWIERGNLVVRGGIDYSISNNKTDEATPQARLRTFALAKLEKYHFHSSHCAEALKNCGENVDKALEVLFNKYFKNGNVFNTDSEIIPPPDELTEIRNDERAVLESIYETSFTIIDKDTWIVKLKLPYLSQIYQEKAVETMKTAKSDYKSNFKTKKKEACKLFLRGSCKYGHRCKFAHQAVQASDSDDKAVQTQNDQNSDYELEIRFPEDTSYPFEPPLIFFKSPNNQKVPPITCLRITAALSDEAAVLAKNGMPSVFSLVEMLNNEEDMIKFIKSDTRMFPLPTDLLYLVPADEDELAEVKPTHYKRSAGRDTQAEVDLQALRRQDKKISLQFLNIKNSISYDKMYISRMQLPAYSQKQEILGTIKKNQVVVISGETGCGKSTQVPQYILDDWLENYILESSEQDNKHVEIVCTQPRRISALGLAERVAAERTDKVGNIVGYQIRLESKVSSFTRLTYCTTGILLRRLEIDPKLRTVTHIVVDEVHERSEESDFLLLILRDLIKVRSDIKVILMSATLNTELFSEYFDKAPIVKIPGRTFPVEKLFLEKVFETTNYILEENGQYTKKLAKGEKKVDLDVELETFDVSSDALIPPSVQIHDENLNLKKVLARYPNCSKRTCKSLYLMDPDKINFDLIEHVLTYIVDGDHKYPKKGSILIFLPGISDIMGLYDQLSESKTFGLKSQSFLILPLHSTLSSEEQARVFKKPKSGVRKIVLSTNIAETSVTIDDCVFVIDCGKMKEKRFDSNRNMESLDTVWISRANVKQRMGRAGRVMPGVCFHLYTSHRYHYMMKEQPVPDIHRVPLEGLLLRILILPHFGKKSIYDVLADMVEPPTKENIKGALSRLQQVGAIDSNLNLTPLGRHLASLPVDVRIGKLMLFGAIFWCLDSALTMAACLSYKSPFVAPFGKKAEADAKRREFACAKSDQLTALRAYRKWEEVKERGRQAALAFCNENFLSQRTLVMLSEIKQQFLTLLMSIGFVPDSPENRGNRTSRLQAILNNEQLNSNGNNDKLLSAILCAALYPNVVKVLTPEKSFLKRANGAIPKHPLPSELGFKTKNDGYVFLHPSSVNSTVGHYTSPYLVFQEKVKTSKIFIKECSMMPSLPLILFTSYGLVVELHGGNFVISLEDGWILFQVETHEVAEMLKAIKIELINLLDEKIQDPSLNLLNYEKGNRIIKTIVEVVTRD